MFLNFETAINNCRVKKHDCEKSVFNLKMSLDFRFFDKNLVFFIIV